MGRAGGTSWAPAAGLVLAAAVMGCGPGQSTRLTSDDLLLVTTSMADSLAASSFLAGRNSQSPPAVIVINKVTNLTLDIIPEAEQWMLMARVRGAMPIQELSGNKNLVFVLDPERAAGLRRQGLEAGPETALKPTHLMGATFHSARRVSQEAGADRHVEGVSDYYYLEYSITRIDSREIVWTGRFELRRSATGRLID